MPACQPLPAMLPQRINDGDKHIWHALCKCRQVDPNASTCKCVFNRVFNGVVNTITSASDRLGAAAASYVSIRRGKRIWEEFTHATYIDHESTQVVALFDQHDVVDTMTYDQAATVGVGIEHIDNVVPLICSFGKAHRKETFNEHAEWSPMVDECKGYVFTDYRDGFYRTVDVYKEDWMMDNCIGVKGDKGQVAALFGLPCVLFDDKEDNIRTLRKRSTPETPLDGVVIRRGRKFRNFIETGFTGSSNCQDWVDIVKRFSQNPAAGIRIHNAWEKFEDCECPSVNSVATAWLADENKLKDACAGELKRQGLNIGCIVVDSNGAYFKNGSREEFMNAKVAKKGSTMFVTNSSC